MPCVKLCCPIQIKIVKISISAMTVPQVGGKSEQKVQCLSPSGLDTGKVGLLIVSNCPCRFLLKIASHKYFAL